MGGAVGQVGLGNDRRGAAGFSLIELLVVIAIVSTLAVGVTLTLGRGDDGGDAARFRAAFETQRALAIEGRSMRGLSFQPKGLQVMVWRMGDTGAGWHALGGVQRWRGRTAFSAVRPSAFGEPEIVFLPSGQSGAFSVVFDSGDERCESDGWAGLTCG